MNLSAADPRTSLEGVRPRLRRAGARWRRLADIALALAILTLSLFVIEGANEGDFALRSLEEVPTGAFFVFVPACAAIIWRRRWPVQVLAVCLAVTTIASVLDYSELIGFTMVLALYGVGRHVANDRLSYAGLGGALAMILISIPIDEAPLGDAVFGLGFLSLIWYIGRRMRFRGERAAQLKRERAADARRMVAEERTRIARELHDVVAHRVSLMTVQAGAAKTVATVDPEGARRAMEAVETAGRQALQELRHLLGVLRPEADLDGLGPQPGLADVPRLVGQFEEAGLEVSLTIEVQDANLPAGVDLSAFRIVQEALTNVLKHAGPGSRAEVHIFTRGNGLGLEVLDDGHSPTLLPGSGHGIVGMRERALLLGGHLDAGPRPGGGWHVVAQLPLESVPP